MIKFLEPILERCWINFAIFLFSAIKVKNKLKFQIKRRQLRQKDYHCRSLKLKDVFYWQCTFLLLSFFRGKLMEVECPSLYVHPTWCWVGSASDKDDRDGWPWSWATLLFIVQRSFLQQLLVHFWKTFRVKLADWISVGWNLIIIYR